MADVSSSSLLLYILWDLVSGGPGVSRARCNADLDFQRFDIRCFNACGSTVSIGGGRGITPGTTKEGCAHLRMDFRWRGARKCCCCSQKRDSHASATPSTVRLSCVHIHSVNSLGYVLPLTQLQRAMTKAEATTATTLIPT